MNITSYTGQKFEYQAAVTNDEVVEVFKQALQAKRIGIDTESNGKDWWTWYGEKAKQQIAGISISIPHGINYYIPLNMKRFFPEDRNANFDLVRHLLQKLIENQVLLIGGNLKHDWHVFWRCLGVDLRKTENRCVLLDSHIFRINNKHSIKELGKEYVSPDADYFERLLVEWKKSAGYKTNFYDYRLLPLGLMVPYAACDTWLSLGIDDYHREHNFEAVYGEYSKTEQQMAKHLWACEEKGIKVDIPYLEQLKEQYEKDIFLEESAVRVYASNAELNIGSPQQLKTVLYDELRLPVQKKWDKEKKEWKVSTDKTAMMMLQGKHPIIEHLQKHRKLEKLYGTYILGILSNYNPHTYRVHTTFNQFVENSDALRTGRLSSSNPLNFENIPRNDTAIRRAFLPDSEFIFCDYSGQEIRLYTLYSREPTLLRAFELGEDVHSRTCEAVFDIPYEVVAANRKTDKDIELKREIAKRIFFGALYGAGAPRVAAILAEFGYGYSEKEGKRLLTNLYTNYPNFPLYTSNVDKRLTQRGFVQDIFGRRYIPKTLGIHYPVANYLIQGTAGGMLKLVTCKLADMFGDDIFANWIHDEIVFDRLSSRAIISEIRAIMQDWPMIDIPMNIDVSWTKQSWKEKEEIKDLDKFIHG